MRLLLINTIEHNYQLYVELNNSSKYTIQLNDLPLEYKDNIVYLLNYLLEQHNITLSALNLIGAITGPGSYTSLRVGLSMVNTLGLTLHIPVIGTTLFEIMLLAYKKRIKQFSQKNILVVVSNNKDGYFGQLYNNYYTENNKPVEFNNENILTYIKLNKNIQIISNNLDIKSIMENYNVDVTIIKINLEDIKASIMNNYYSKGYKNNSFLEALYIKPPKITMPKVRIK